MTLDTKVQVLDEVDVPSVFNKCRELLGATDDYTWKDEPCRYREGESCISNDGGQGLPAWLMVYYRPSAPLRTPQEWAQCDEDCEDGCDASHSYRLPAWCEVSFDTAYGYRDDRGLGCGGLHAMLVAKLGRWLDEREVRWSWTDEFTGETFGGPERYERLLTLEGSGTAAAHWLQTVVVPLITRESS